MLQTNSIVSIAWREIIKKYPALDTSNFSIFSKSSNKEVVFQLECLEKKESQNLLLKVNLVPGKSEKLVIKNSRPSKFESQTFCRYVPERKDDFAWENNKIDFRVYGKALEGTKENANEIDVWVKRTTKR